MAKQMNRTEMKLDAQDRLMHGIANVLGYFTESHAPKGWDDWSPAEQAEYYAIMKREADRVARLFGFDEAWTN
jgi:hypothetical protein